MDVRKFVLKECGIIAAGELILVAAMVGIYALIGEFHWTVAVGGVVGAVLAVGNFFFMALSANAAADKAIQQDVKGGKNMIKSSYLLRVLMIFVLLIVLSQAGVCNPLAMVLPLLFVRPILTVTEFFRKPGDQTDECQC